MGNRLVMRRLGGVRRFSEVQEKMHNKEYFKKATRESYITPSATPGRISSLLYHNLMKSMPVYATVLCGVAIVGDLWFDSFTGAMWRMNNKGKLFDDVIPSRFPNLPPGCEDDEEEDDDEDEE